MIDLHCHSTASDGAFSPAELPVMAKAAGISALALTDHDTTAGLAAFIRSAGAIGFHAVPGIELAISEETVKCHLLGLFLDPDSDELQDALRRIVAWRNERNIRMLEVLGELGLPLTMDEVVAASEEGEVIGRPHIAKAMMRRGYCASEEGAFKKYLRRGRPGYVQRKTLGFKEAVDLLHRCGALTVWAHPMTSQNMTNAGLSRRLDWMKEAGLDGVEAYYPSHTPVQMQTICELAAEKGLLVSGGTDFHGGGSHAGVELGVGYGKGFQVPDALLERMEDVRTAPYVFFDRDGTLVYDVPYNGEPSEVRLVPGCCEALRRLSSAGYRIAEISNQSGIGRGLITHEAFARVQMRLAELLAEGGAGLDAVYYCPHVSAENCRCRKPRTGMLEQACAEHRVDVARSFLVGDSPSDIEAGRAFGLSTIQICLPGTDKADAHADYRVASLREATDIILEKTSRSIDF